VGIAGTGEGWQSPSGSVWWKVEAEYVSRGVVEIGLGPSV